VTREEDVMEKVMVRGVAFNRDEAQLTILGIPDIPGIAAKILTPISDSNIEVDMIVQNIGSDSTTDFTFTVHRNDYCQAKQVLEQIAATLGARECSGNDHIAKVSIVGVGMRSHAGVASQMFNALADKDINIHMISTSEIKISIVIDEDYLELATRTLHHEFDMSNGGSETDID
jgi:aspartate kinase